MTVDYHKHNQVVTPITSISPDLVSLLEHINTLCDNEYATTEWANFFFLISLLTEIIRNSLLLAGRPTIHLAILPLGYINSLALCHNLIGCDLDHLSLP